MTEYKIVIARIPPRKHRALKARLATGGLTFQEMVCVAVDAVLAQQLPGDRSAPKPHAEVNDAPA
jgi:hypothetical protein